LLAVSKDCPSIILPCHRNATTDETCIFYTEFRSMYIRMYVCMYEEVRYPPMAATSPWQRPAHGNHQSMVTNTRNRVMSHMQQHCVTHVTVSHHTQQHCVTHATVSHHIQQHCVTHVTVSHHTQQQHVTHLTVSRRTLNSCSCMSLCIHARSNQPTCVS